MYHHDGEDESRDKVGDGEDTDCGADGETDGRTTQSCHEQRRTVQQELHKVQPQSFTVTHHMRQKLQPVV